MNVNRFPNWRRGRWNNRAKCPSVLVSGTLRRLFHWHSAISEKTGPLVQYEKYYFQSIFRVFWEYSHTMELDKTMEIFYKIPGPIFPIFPFFIRTVETFVMQPSIRKELNAAFSYCAWLRKWLIFYFLYSS